MTNGNDRDDDVIDARVRALYRGASSEEPPAHVDDALRAAARRAVAAGPRSSSKAARRARITRSWWPLAAAATIGAVAIGIVDLAERDEQITHPSATVTAPTSAPSRPVDERPSASTDAPDSQERSPVAGPTVPMSSRVPPRTSAKAANREPQTKLFPSEPAQEKSRESNAAADTLGRAESPQAFPAQNQAQVAAGAAPVPAAPAAAPSAEASSVSKPSMPPASAAARMMAPSTPAATFEQQVKAIEALLQLGRYDEARRDLMRLRTAYPNRMSELPRELRALLPPTPEPPR